MDDFFLTSLIIIGWIGTIALTAIHLLSKCFFLAPFRIGWLMMFANVIYETFFKKCHWRRWTVDCAGLIFLTICWSALAGPWIGLAVGLLMAGAWTITLRIDQTWRNGKFAHQDKRYLRRVPIPVPRLIFSIQGPVLDRGSIHDLGDWPLNWQDRFELLILNASPIVHQFPLNIKFLQSNAKVQTTPSQTGKITCPAPGQFIKIPFTIQTTEITESPSIVSVQIDNADETWTKQLKIRSVFNAGTNKIKNAVIEKWKGGARAGFAWRGDQDLYDPATYQSEEGLRHALGLSMRFRLPSTLYISGSLSLNQDDHKAFCSHFGWDRRSEEIPEFIRFLREKVTIKSEMDFPMECEREFAMELGNHMYVHLGTHTGAAAGNNWKSHAWIGDGKYPWQSEGEANSFTEQRDNAIANNKIINEKIGVNPTSWGVPGRTFDEYTARALEAAGIEFGTDTDASGFINVFKLPAPHHPKGCKKLVEITKKYPGDPDNAYKVAMLKYWARAARRHGRVFLFMAHHHLLAYEGCAGTNMANELFYYLLGESYGDFYTATVTSLGKYWQAVMSPKNKCIKVEIKTTMVEVENAGSECLEKLPLEIEWENGRRMMTLVNVEDGAKTTIIP